MWNEGFKKTTLYKYIFVLCMIPIAIIRLIFPYLILMSGVSFLVTFSLWTYGLRSELQTLNWKTSLAELTEMNINNAGCRSGPSFDRSKIRKPTYILKYRYNASGEIYTSANITGNPAFSETVLHCGLTQVGEITEQVKRDGFLWIYVNPSDASQAVIYRGLHWPSFPLVLLGVTLLLAIVFWPVWRLTRME